MSIKRFQDNIDVESVKDAVIENWLSTTREDCLALAKIRPYGTDLPVIAQIRAMEDLKAYSLKDTAERYGVTPNAIYRWRRYGIGKNKGGWDKLDSLVSWI